jgi:hypothetical protein
MLHLSVLIINLSLRAMFRGSANFFMDDTASPAKVNLQV